jgi:hypothetical protein
MAETKGDPAAVARQVGVSEHYVRGTLLALRGGTSPAPSASPSSGGCGSCTAHGELQTSGPDEQGNEPLTLKLIL